jgi:hypothetical protein
VTLEDFIFSGKCRNDGDGLHPTIRSFPPSRAHTQVGLESGHLVGRRLSPPPLAALPAGATGRAEAGPPVRSLGFLELSRVMFGVMPSRRLPLEVASGLWWLAAELRRMELLPLQ